MSRKTLRPRDEFTFSLGGLTTIASFVPAPVVPDNVFRAAPARVRSRNPRRRKLFGEQAVEHGNSTS
ncbi:MAG: hypothetical protein ACNA8J_08145 [Gammaproteobacteria bacterium]